MFKFKIFKISSSFLMILLVLFSNVSLADGSIEQSAMCYSTNAFGMDITDITYQCPPGAKEDWRIWLGEIDGRLVDCFAYNQNYFLIQRSFECPITLDDSTKPMRVELLSNYTPPVNIEANPSDDTGFMNDSMMGY